MPSLTQLDGVVATDLPLPKRFPARESPIAFVLTGLALPGRLGLATCLVALYVLLGWVVNTFATVPLTEPPWNPSSGLGLACLLTLGLSWTPVLYLGILISELTVSLAQPSLAQAILESALSTAGYVALAGLLRSGPLAIDIRLTRTRDMVIFSLTTGSVTLLMALFYAMLRSDLDVMLTFGDARHLVRFWIGELVGILVFAPLLLLFWAGRLRFSLRSQDAFLHGFGIFLTVLFAFWVV